MLGRGRPARLKLPALWLIRPQGDERPEGPAFGASAYVYAESVLLRSWLALRQRAEFILPTDIEPLIEGVYGHGDRTAGEFVAARLAALDAAYEEQTQARRNRARAVVLSEPGSDDPFEDLARVRDDDDPSIHPALRAATRLREPSIDIVPVLERDDGCTVLVGMPQIVLDLGAKEPPPRRVVIAAARRTVAVSDRRVVAALINQPVPRTFGATGHLRFHRALRFDARGRATVGGIRLTLDPELGLVVGSLAHTEDAPVLTEKACDTV